MVHWTFVAAMILAFAAACASTGAVIDGKTRVFVKCFCCDHNDFLTAANQRERIAGTP